MQKTQKTSKKDVNAPKKKRDFHRKDARKEANSIKKRYPGSILSQDIHFFHSESICSSLWASRFSMNLPSRAAEMEPVSSETMIAIASDFSETPIAER